MARPPLSQRAPGNPFPERETNVIEVVQAVPARSRLGNREGNRWASEGTSLAPNTRNAFGAAFMSDRDEPGTVSVVQAGQAAGRVEPGLSSPRATWDAVPQVDLDQFSGGASGDQATGYAPQHVVRPGYNQSTIGPTWGLAAGEVTGNVVVTQLAPENGGRNRPSIADVTHLERY